MAKFFSVLMVCLCFLNCTKKENTIQNTPYVISKHSIISNISNKPRDTNIPPPPPLPGGVAYGTNTFIIDNNSKIYYFQREKIGRVCITEPLDTIPYFINLQPKDLIEIPPIALSEFIKLNHKDNFRNITIISSKLDTLKSENYFNLIKAIESYLKEKDLYFIRRTTQEEDTVLKYKKNNEPYYSDIIKWDRNRIKFPLIKPKLNH
ncbi:hypothetical protein [Flavobacterium sp. MDT1-60]|uniref:hypothetical protein n=1 Tax=Flavobacterium sp. MDT1-60 TaxID=1979344 RepID=UPI00177AEFDF|nr:hypothetical protein [Flavobacterium sp. MDT1-60]QOG02734.1 hypothetical protein IHE43_00365 [Flavobacterium sp. MDT1-60]